MHDGYYSGQPGVLGLVGRMDFLLASFHERCLRISYFVSISGAIAFHGKPWSALWDAAQYTKTGSKLWLTF